MITLILRREILGHDTFTELAIRCAKRHIHISVERDTKPSDVPFHISREIRGKN